MTLCLENCVLLDMVHADPQHGAVVTIEGDRIARVGRRADFGSALNDETPRIDLGGCYLMPGIADSHVHLTQALSTRFGTPDALSLQPDAALAYLCEQNAWQALRRGLTMLRVVGEGRFLDVHLRNAIDNGTVVGPRLFVSGHLIIRTAGHGHGMISSVEVDGPYEAVKAVRQQVAAGADFIKLMVTGGVASMTDPVDRPQFLDEELEAAVRAARLCGKVVAVHAGEPRIIERCARLGVTSVEHGYIMDERAAQAMAECGTYLVPTLVVTHDWEYISNRPQWVQEKVKRVAEKHVRSFELARAAGVKIVAGTDVPDFKEYIYREIELLSSMGMRGAEVLTAATRTPAEMCGLSAHLGTVEPGKFADLIVIGSDPREPRGLRDLKMVIKGGVVHLNNLARASKGWW